MNDDLVLTEIHPSGYAVLTLNRPDNANVLDMQMGRDLLAAVTACEQDAALRAVMLTGAGKHFCFGGDLRGMQSSGGAPDAYLRELTTNLHRAIVGLVRLDAPVIAIVK